MERKISKETKQYLVGALALTLSVVGVDVTEERLHPDIPLHNIEVSEYTYENDIKPQYYNAMKTVLQEDKSICEVLTKGKNQEEKDKCENQDSLLVWEDIANKEVRDQGCKAQVGSKIIDGVFVENMKDDKSLVGSFNDVIKNGC